MPLVTPTPLVTLVTLVTPENRPENLPEKRRCSPRRDVNASRGFGR